MSEGTDEAPGELAGAAPSAAPPSVEAPAAAPPGMEPMRPPDAAPAAAPDVVPGAGPDAEFLGQAGGQVTGKSRMEVAYGAGDDEVAASAQVGAQTAAGTIFEQVYRPWNGTLNPRWARNWAILRHHMYGIVAKGHRPWGWPTRLVLFTVLLASLGDLAMLGLSQLLQVDELARIFGLNRANLYRHVLGYLPCNALLFPLVAALLIGGMISEDRENGTSALYFSRPINRRDYIAMKYVSVAGILGIIIVGTLAAFYLGGITIGGEGWAYLAETLPLFGAAAAAGTLLVLTYTSIGLALSAVSRGRFFPAVAFLAVLYGTRGVAFLIEQLFDQTLLYLLSPYDAVAHIGQVILGLEPRYDHPWAWSLVMVILMNGLSLYVLSARVSSMEVTRE